MTQATRASASELADSSKKWSLAAAFGSVVSAFAASICCLGPLVLALLGLGGAGLIMRVERFRPHLVAVALLLLGAAFVVSNGRRPAAAVSGQSSPACACPAPRASRLVRTALWTAAALVLTLLAFPLLPPALFQSAEVP
ncbi:MAG TPA: mercuric transporter MerT family protein [Polyangiaceae bacterium]|nr:mercuric transporter MerT family protein [Polyangiaceae bacterium]